MEKIELYENGNITYKWNEETKAWEWTLISGDKNKLGKLIKEYDESGWKKRIWCRTWKGLDEKDQIIIWAVFGKDSLREKFKNEILTLKDPRQLLRSALKCFYLIGWNKPCGRCGGSGRYSYCERFKDKCFRCSGTKDEITTPTKRDLEKLIRLYPEGIAYSEDYKKHAITGKGKYKREIQKETVAAK